jgi:hypothetical protein
MMHILVPHFEECSPDVIATVNLITMSSFSVNFFLWCSCELGFFFFLILSSRFRTGNHPEEE